MNTTIKKFSRPALAKKYAEKLANSEAGLIAYVFKTDTVLRYNVVSGCDPVKDVENFKLANGGTLVATFVCEL